MFRVMYMRLNWDLPLHHPPLSLSFWGYPPFRLTIKIIIMSDVKFIKSVSLETWKKNNSVTTIEVYLSKNGNKYFVHEDEAIMYTRDLDKTKPMHIVTVTDGTDTWSFLGNSTRTVVETL